MHNVTSTTAIANTSKESFVDELLFSLSKNKWNINDKGLHYQFSKRYEGFQVDIEFDKFGYTHFGHKFWFPLLIVFSLGLGPFLLMPFYPGANVSFKKPGQKWKYMKLSFRERWALRCWYIDWLKSFKEKNKKEEQKLIFLTLKDN